MTYAEELSAPVVVKVGGSLFELPDLRSRLVAWLKELGVRASATAGPLREGEAPAELGGTQYAVRSTQYCSTRRRPRPPEPLHGLPVILVPGGGRAAAAVRELDRRHGLGEEHSHWLALSAMALNARFLAAWLPRAAIAGCVKECLEEWRRGYLPVLDAQAFALGDEGQSGCLPHSWDVTSDSVAARAAAVIGARRLVLLKSRTLPVGTTWEEASRQGIVDSHFPAVAGRGFAVEVINLREWNGS